MTHRHPAQAAGCSLQGTLTTPVRVLCRLHDAALQHKPYKTMDIQEYTLNELDALFARITAEKQRRHECRPVYVVTRGTPKQTFQYGLDVEHDAPPEGDGVYFVQRPANHPDNVVLRSLYGGHVIGFADKAHPDLVTADDGRNPPRPTFRAYTELVDGKHVPARCVDRDGYGNPFNRMLDTHVHCTDDKWWPVDECEEHFEIDEDDREGVTYTHNPALAAS